MSETTTAEDGGAVRIVAGLATDRGLRRELNEDALVATDILFAVADGMGGHEAGEVASSICVRTLAESDLLAGAAGPVTAADVQELLLRADARIREATDSRAGTTLTGVVLTTEQDRPSWLFFNIGDSRSYRLAAGRLTQITVDHSEVQELVDLGHITPEEALYHPRRHVVTRALGTGIDLVADFWLLPVEPGERLLLCSDGLTVEVPDVMIGTILATVADPQDAADALAQAAVAAGGRDNVTVIVIDAVGDGPDDEARLTAALRPADGDADGTPDDEPDDDAPPRRRRLVGSTAVDTAGVRVDARRRDEPAAGDGGVPPAP